MENNKEYINSGNGVLYINKDKKNEKQPDYTGPITVLSEPDNDGKQTERKLRISVWNIKDAGKDYNMSFKLQYEKGGEEETVPF